MSVLMSPEVMLHFLKWLRHCYRNNFGVQFQGVISVSLLVWFLIFNVIKSEVDINKKRKYLW